MSNRIEISYNALKNFRAEELRIVLLKYFKKFEIIRITNLPLVNFQTQLTRKFMEKVKSNENIHLAEVNAAKSYIDIVSKGKKADIVIPRIIPTDQIPTTKLEKEKFICEKVIGKSSNYGEFTVYRWLKEQEVNLETGDKVIIDAAKNFLKQYPSTTHQGFDENRVRMPSSSYSSKGCFIASYLTAAGFEITDETEMQRMLTGLHKNGHIKDDNNASFQVVNYLNVGRSLVIPKIKPLVLTNHYMIQLGSISLNSYVASISHITDNKLLEEVCAAIEVLMAIMMPGIFEAFKPDRKEPRFTKLVNVNNLMLKHDINGYSQVMQIATEKILASLVGTMNIGTVEAALFASLNGLVGENSDDLNYAMSAKEAKIVFDLICAARLSRVVSCVLYKIGKGHHMVVAYPYPVANHVPIFDPRWSGCNRAVMYHEASKAWNIIHDLLYCTEEFDKYLKVIKCKLDMERYVVDLAMYAKYWDYGQKIGVSARTQADSVEYELLLKTINRMFTIPDNAQKSYDNAKGTKLSRLHDLWTPTDVIAMDDLHVMEVA